MRSAHTTCYRTIVKSNWCILPEIRTKLSVIFCFVWNICFTFLLTCILKKYSLFPYLGKLECLLLMPATSTLV
jgi:hypothetical protein